MFALMGGSVFALDMATKWLVRETFFLGQTRPVVGSFFRLTYIVNPGAAFGIQLGVHSRLVVSVLGAVVLLLLLALYRWTPLEDRSRLAAIALLCGGAMGNLLDRVFSSAGVVDFLDVGTASMRAPIFNVADIAIASGAVLLAFSFWREGYGEVVESDETQEDEARGDGARAGSGGTEFGAASMTEHEDTLGKGGKPSG